MPLPGDVMVSKVLVMDFGDKLEMLVKRRKLSQAKLGEIVGVSQQRISHVRHGKADFTAPQVKAVAEALGVSIDYLMDDSQDEPPVFPVAERERMILDVARTMGLDRAWRLLVERPEIPGEVPAREVTPNVTRKGGDGEGRQNKRGAG